MTETPDKTGLNPTQEKARKLYEWWLSGSGAVKGGIELDGKPQDIRLFSELEPYEQQRWMMLAKALGDHPYHDHIPGSVEHRAEKYKSIPEGLSWAEYDDILNPKDLGYTKLRQHWWQLWRPRHEKLAETSP